jgi:phosphoribosylformylglycinamidine synthase
MRSFSDVVDGIAAACEKFETPIVSGNVSFYNETDGSGILPTPTIGMVGLVDDVRKLITHGFKNEGDLIALLGVTNEDVSISEFARTIAGLSTNEMSENGNVPQLDLDLEANVQNACLALADKMLLNSAHDCSDGGLAVTIAESCFSSLGREAIGAEIELATGDISKTALLFGESPSRIVISFPPENLTTVTETVGDCPFFVIGKVTDDVIKITVDGTEAISMNVSKAEAVWESSLEKSLG